MYKKMISLLLAITLSSILLAGCGSTGQPTGAAESVPDTAGAGAEPEEGKRRMWWLTRLLKTRSR